MAAERSISAALLVLAALAATAAAQTSDIPPCVLKLQPCLEYLGKTNPSAQCCESIREVLDKDLPCLCPVLKNTEFTKLINVTQASELPKHCKNDKTLSVCDSVTAASPAGAPGSSPAAGSGSGSGTTPAGSSPRSGVDGLATVRISALMSLLIFWLFIVS